MKGIFKSCNNSAIFSSPCDFKHPQEVVPPFLKFEPLTNTVPPQSHLQNQVFAPYFSIGPSSITVSLPYLFPSSSIYLVF